MATTISMWFLYKNDHISAHNEQILKDHSPKIKSWEESTNPPNEEEKKPPTTSPLRSDKMIKHTYPLKTPRTRFNMKNDPTKIKTMKQTVDTIGRLKS